MYELGFQDANFSHRFAWCRSPLEGRSLRWIPCGMPRLNPQFQNCVFFLYGKDPNTGAVKGPMGTGFFVGIIPRNTPAYGADHVYAVTCHHVAVKAGRFHSTINTEDGKSRHIESEPHEWQFIRNGDDLCAVDLHDQIQPGDAISCISDDLLMRRDFIEHDEVGIGEDGFMLGLFADHPGKRQNLVAARFGNLSMLARDDEPIEQPNEQKRPSHIFDIRSRPGFSARPYSSTGRQQAIYALRPKEVFPKPWKEPLGARRKGTSDGNGTPILDSFFEEMQIQENTFLMLLGIHAGQYPEKIEAKKIRRTVSEVDDDIIRDSDKLKIPSSMTVVVPAWEIVNLLNQPFFAEIRGRRNEMKRQQRDRQNIPEAELTTDAPVIEKPVSSADDANPNHQADFTRLVDVAARKRPQGDQT